MKLFIDTANVDQVAEIASWGVLDGVTTNPSLVAKEEGADFKETVTKMCGLVNEVSAQITATEFEEMKKQADEYSSWHKNVVVKVPMTVEGLKTLNYCSSKGIHTNTTLVFSVPQAVMAAKSGATMISPFVGRLDDLGMDGMELIQDIRTAWDHYNFDTQILVASVRNTEHVHRAATIGAHIATIPYKVFQELPQHDLTDKGLKKFMEDWESVQNR
ncbi:fructose-6-phosphate aldolase [bacterium]|nr:fructose-6-phosphate aldolase [bacterium]